MWSTPQQIVWAIFAAKHPLRTVRNPAGLSPGPPGLRPGPREEGPSGRPRSLRSPHLNHLFIWPLIPRLTQ